MTLDSFNAFTVTVTPQSVLWKYSKITKVNLIAFKVVNIVPLKTADKKGVKLSTLSINLED